MRALSISLILSLVLTFSVPVSGMGNQHPQGGDNPGSHGSGSHSGGSGGNPSPPPPPNNDNNDDKKDDKKDEQKDEQKGIGRSFSS